VKPFHEDDERWRAVLTPSERERADRFQFAADRCRFTVTRGLLRAILARYAGVEPEAARFDHNRFGKPSLTAAQNPSCVSFNVAHSGDWSLLAFACGVEVGVDVEDTRAERGVVDVAERLFSPAEYGAFLGLPAGARRRAFFRTWTRKESVAKALGFGLSMPFASLDTSPAGWLVLSFDVDDTHTGAVAVRAADVSVRFWSATQTGPSLRRVLAGGH
jgi:4'-phosphopantetheinyl transferase